MTAVVHLKEGPPRIHHLNFKATLNPNHRVVAVYITPILKEMAAISRGNIQIKRLGVDKPTDLEVVSVRAHEAEVEVLVTPQGQGRDDDPVALLMRRQKPPPRRTGMTTRQETPPEPVMEKKEGTVIAVTLHKQDVADEELTVYELVLKGIPQLTRPHDRARFSLKSLEAVTASSKPKQQDQPCLGFEIDYQSRDFNSLTRFIYEQMSRLVPDWKEKHIPDQGVALVELLAYVGDYFSYYQDAVATEAYLETARRRISVRRHARLLDYRLHEGCSARAWVHLETSDRPYELKARARFVSGGQKVREPLLVADSFAYHKALESNLPFFESLHAETLYPHHNRISIYTWGKPDYALRKGATSTILEGELFLKRGDVIVFEERISPETGRAQDANPKRRHAVRLKQVERHYAETLHDDIRPELLDMLAQKAQREQLSEQQTEALISEILDAAPDKGRQVPMVRITWHVRDALPFDFPVSLQDGAITRQDISVVRGNMVLVQHGRLRKDIDLGRVPDVDEFTPALPAVDLSYHVPYQHALGNIQSAADIMDMDPREAVPAIKLTQVRPETDLVVTGWEPVWDLMDCRQFDRNFVVEADWRRELYLRFGNGIQGWKPDPGHRFKSSFYTGSGATGNVGHDTINQLVVDTDHPFTDGQIIAVRNPLPGKGGHEPEDVERARRFAPEAFHRPDRCVTEEDYAARADRLPDVNKAVARIRWTGSWQTVYLMIDRTGGFPITPAFRERLHAHFSPFQMAGHDLEIGPPDEVALSIRLMVGVKSDYAGNAVRQDLLETLSNAYLANGRPAYFHPDRWTFGESVYLSPILAEVMHHPGVDWVEPTTFSRMDGTDPGAKKAGVIIIGPLETARLDNNPMQPYYGTLDIATQGGI